ncbi:unnamed protein product [Ceratitis capitata]|uniref:(Mediterranean fruit fly) hypothetical protein n=1 Tax=Ceratitis capitata TaxID=7213 RepID=A0A811VKD2_CERCA|nr:unnamed protein product [Ceratitis capitata]
MSSQSSTRYLPIAKMDNPALSGSSGDVEADCNTVEASLPATCSSQQLMPPSSDTDSVGVQRPATGITRTQWFTVVVLCFVNLINYMDRFTIAGRQRNDTLAAKPNVHNSLLLFNLGSLCQVFERSSVCLRHFELD